MSNDELFQALRMFQDGVGKLQMSRAINDANDQVNQIKAGEQSEADKRAALQGISNGLVMHMAAMGAPDTTIQSVQGAIGPKSYANSNAMYQEGMLRQDPALQAQATQLQGFEQNPEYKKQLIMAKAAMHNPMQEMKFNEMKQQFADKENDKVFKDANPSLSSRSNLGLIAKNLTRINEAESLASDPSKITVQQLYELPKVMDSILSQGTGTQSGTEHLMPNTARLNMAKMKEMLTSNPQLANSPEFVNMYGDSINRIKQTAIGVARNQIKSVLKSQGAAAAARDPEGFKERAASLLQGYGGDEVVHIDPKTKRVVFKSDLEEKNLQDVIQEVLKDPSNPDHQRAFELAQQDPNYYGALASHPALSNKVRMMLRNQKPSGAK